MTNESYSLEQVLEAVSSLKQEKGITKVLDLVKEKIFGNLNKENIEEFKSFVREFSSLYYLMKHKFSEEKRDGGERYFEHLREVVINVLDLPNPNLKKVLIAIAHDAIEDTNKTFEGLNEDYGVEVALGVEAISKEHWEKYIDTSLEGEKQEKEAKSKRNKAYFGYLESFDTFKNHISSLALSRGIELAEEKLIEITKNALDVKFADRIHNLSTQWNPSDLEQVKKKVNETKKYFLNIAKKVNIEAFNKIQTEILKLEIRLNGAQLSTLTILASSTKKQQPTN